MSSVPEPKKQPKRPARGPDTEGPAKAPRKPAIFEGYDAALEHLKTRLNVEQMTPARVDVPQVFNLERMTALMAALDDPQKELKAIHVAGSKGKGSVCEMTAASLVGCGYTVGLYTSPHLVHLSERIRINNQPIADAAFAEHLATVAAAAATLPKKLGDATYFELLTALAFLYFAREAVDVAVIETGMGGRVDATNIITPQVCAITAIQKEHTLLLGDTVEKIAKEKAGIMKPGVPCVTVPQTEGVLTVLREHAAAVGCTLEVLEKEIDFSYRFEATTQLGPHARICLYSPRSCFEHLPVPLKGEHQALNCGLTLAILDRLRERGLETPEARVAVGLAGTPSNGRLEQVLSHPRVFIDGAHNPESMQALVKAVGANVRYDSMVVVFGCASDKDIPGLLSAIATGADKIFFTRASGNERAVDPRDLNRRFQDIAVHKMTQWYATLEESLRNAANAVHREDIILVTGSFAIAGEAKRYLQRDSRAAASARAASATLREVKTTPLADTSPRPRPRHA